MLSRIQHTTTLEGGKAIRTFRKAMRRLEQEIEKALAVQTECCSVSKAQCHLLLEIAEVREGSIGNFAERLELDISTLSRGIESLVKAGLATREADSSNRRKQIVSLTPDGLAKAKAINETCDAYYVQLLEALPPELQTATVQAVPLLAMAMKQARTTKVDPACLCGSGDMQS